MCFEEMLQDITKGGKTILRQKLITLSYHSIS